MKTLLFEIQAPHANVERLSIEAEQVLLGSGAHCDVRLPLDQARVEHLRIDVTPQGVFATALSYEPPPTMNGAPFSQVALQQGVPILVAGTSILVSLQESSKGASAGRKASQSSPLTLVLGVVLLGAVGYLAMDTIVPSEASKPAPKAPVLFEKAATVCPYQGQQALSYGEQNLTLAESLRERTPFAVEDGVKAVTHFRLAAACYQSAAQPSYVRYAEEGANALENDLDRDYRKERIRLQRGLEYLDWNRARNSVRRLLAFTEGRDDVYRSWLRDLDSQLQRKAKRDP